MDGQFDLTVCFQNVFNVAVYCQNVLAVYARPAIGLPCGVRGQPLSILPTSLNFYNFCIPGVLIDRNVNFMEWVTVSPNLSIVEILYRPLYISDTFRELFLSSPLCKFLSIISLTVSKLPLNYVSTM